MNTTTRKVARSIRSQIPNMTSEQRDRALAKSASLFGDTLGREIGATCSWCSIGRTIVTEWETKVAANAAAAFFTKLGKANVSVTFDVDLGWIASCDV